MRHDRVEGRTDASDRPEPARRRFAGSLRGRLLVVALAVIGPLVVGAGLWILLLSRSTGEYEGLTNEVARESAESVRLLRYLSTAEHDGGRYMETGRADDLRAFRRTAVRIDAALRQTDNYDEAGEILGLVSIRRPWELAKDQIEAYQPQRDRAMIDSPGTDREDQFEADVDLAAAGLQRLKVSSQEEGASDLAAADRAVRLNWLLGVCGVVVALFLAALLASRLSKSLVRPLEQLARAARSLAAGHLGHRVDIDSTSELNEVGGTFNAMAEALQEQREELERHALANSLTGLANRALFEDRTRHALERAAGRPERVAVLVLDVDGFKLVNDGLGHTCGDALLRHAAERMTGMIRPSDTLARLGS